MFRPICKPFILLASTLLLVSVVSANAVAPSDSTIALLQKAVDGDWRSAAHKARDQYWHPIETLEFFGLKPDMTVIELDPGGGWSASLPVNCQLPSGCRQPTHSVDTCSSAATCSNSVLLRRRIQVTRPYPADVSMNSR